MRESAVTTSEQMQKSPRLPLVAAVAQLVVDKRVTFLTGRWGKKLVCEYGSLCFTSFCNLTFFILSGLCSVSLDNLFL